MLSVSIPNNNITLFYIHITVLSLVYAAPQAGNESNGTTTIPDDKIEKTPDTVTPASQNPPIDPPSRCPSICPLAYHPICGTDIEGISRTFPTECALKAENCLTNSSM